MRITVKLRLYRSRSAVKTSRPETFQQRGGELGVTAARFSFSNIAERTAFGSAAGPAKLQAQRAAHNLQRLAKSRLEEADVVRGNVTLEIRKEREARRRI